MDVHVDCYSKRTRLLSESKGGVGLGLGIGSWNWFPAPWLRDAIASLPRQYHHCLCRLQASDLLPVQKCYRTEQSEAIILKVCRRLKNSYCFALSLCSHFPSLPLSLCPHRRFRRHHHCSS